MSIQIHIFNVLTYAMFHEEIIFFFCIGWERLCVQRMRSLCCSCASLCVCVCVLLSYSYCFVKFVVKPIIFYYYLILINLLVIGNLFLLKGGSCGQQLFKKLLFLTWAESRCVISPYIFFWTSLCCLHVDVAWCSFRL